MGIGPYINVGDAKDLKSWKAKSEYQTATDWTTSRASLVQQSQLTGNTEKGWAAPSETAKGLTERSVGDCAPVAFSSVGPQPDGQRGQQH